MKNHQIKNKRPFALKVILNSLIIIGIMLIFISKNNITLSILNKLSNFYISKTSSGGNNNSYFFYSFYADKTLERRNININKVPSKIMIFGRPGSGKSTFAVYLSQILNLPVYHLDKYFFQSNWVARPVEEFLGILQNIVGKEAWVIDGNATEFLEIRYSKADLVLYFNYPKPISYIRVFKRFFNKDVTINDRAEGCDEKITLSLLGYVWSFEKKVATKIKVLRAKYPNVKFIEVVNDNMLKELQNKLLSFKTVCDTHF
ncbi:P-loop NTPase family protein [Candidatus Phycorickettsia trachydisci]|nr:hypothetical protein [Candidatus Phycorickettsia trachydisci]